MATWASRRKWSYAGIILAVFALVILLFYFFFFYKAPTCSDGKRNDSEQGVDCGGACKKLCQSSYLGPQFLWGGAKFEKVGEGLYNLSAYVVNPNPDGAAINVPYKFNLYDAKGGLIIERKGKSNIPAHRNILFFESLVKTGKDVPIKATIEFLSSPQWFKSSDNLGGLVIVNKKYNEDQDGSNLQVILENKSFQQYNNLTVAAVLYDNENNVIGFSQTKIDTIYAKGGQETAVFTWPISRQGKVTSIEVLPAMEPTMDK